MHSSQSGKKHRPSKSPGIPLVGHLNLSPPSVEHLWKPGHMQSPSLSGSGYAAKSGQRPLVGGAGGGPVFSASVMLTHSMAKCTRAHTPGQVSPHAHMPHELPM